MPISCLQDDHQQQILQLLGEELLLLLTLLPFWIPNTRLPNCPVFLAPALLEHVWTVSNACKMPFPTWVTQWNVMLLSTFKYADVWFGGISICLAWCINILSSIMGIHMDFWAIPSPINFRWALKLHNMLQDWKKKKTCKEIRVDTALC